MRTRALPALAAAIVSIAVCSGCGTSCDDVRQEAQQLREQWETSSEGDTCIWVPASNDCTGLLGCPFAVRASVEAQAKQDATRLANESAGCSDCAEAKCTAATLAVCEAGRCVAK